MRKEKSHIHTERLSSVNTTQRPTNAPPPTSSSASSSLTASSEHGRESFPCSDFILLSEIQSIVECVGLSLNTERMEVLSSESERALRGVTHLFSRMAGVRAHTDHPSSSSRSSVSPSSLLSIPSSVMGTLYMRLMYLCADTGGRGVRATNPEHSEERRASSKASSLPSSSIKSSLFDRFFQKERKSLISLDVASSTVSSVALKESDVESIEIKSLNELLLDEEGLKECVSSDEREEDQLIRLHSDYSPLLSCFSSFLSSHSSSFPPLFSYCCFIRLLLFIVSEQSKQLNCGLMDCPSVCGGEIEEGGGEEVNILHVLEEYIPLIIAQSKQWGLSRHALYARNEESVTSSSSLSSHSYSLGIIHFYHGTMKLLTNLYSTLLSDYIYSDLHLFSSVVTHYKTLLLHNSPLSSSHTSSLEMQYTFDKKVSKLFIHSIKAQWAALKKEYLFMIEKKGEKEQRQMLLTFTRQVLSSMTVDLMEHTMIIKQCSLHSSPYQHNLLCFLYLFKLEMNSLLSQYSSHSIGALFFHVLAAITLFNRSVQQTFIEPFFPPLISPSSTVSSPSPSPSPSPLTLSVEYDLSSCVNELIDVNTLIREQLEYTVNSQISKVSHWIRKSIDLEQWKGVEEDNAQLSYSSSILDSFTLIYSLVNQYFVNLFNLTINSPSSSFLYIISSFAILKKELNLLIKYYCLLLMKDVQNEETVIPASLRGATKKGGGLREMFHRTHTTTSSDAPSTTSSSSSLSPSISSTSSSSSSLPSHRANLIDRARQQKSVHLKESDVHADEQDEPHSASSSHSRQPSGSPFLGPNSSPSSPSLPSSNPHNKLDPSILRCKIASLCFCIEKIISLNAFIHLKWEQFKEDAKQKYRVTSHTASHKTTSSPPSSSSSSPSPSSFPLNKNVVVIDEKYFLEWEMAYGLEFTHEKNKEYYQLLSEETMSDVSSTQSSKEKEGEKAKKLLYARQYTMRDSVQLLPLCGLMKECSLVIGECFQQLISLYSACVVYEQWKVPLLDNLYSPSPSISNLSDTGELYQLIDSTMASLYKSAHPKAFNSIVYHIFKHLLIAMEWIILFREKKQGRDREKEREKENGKDRGIEKQEGKEHLFSPLTKLASVTFSSSSSSLLPFSSSSSSSSSSHESGVTTWKRISHYTDMEAHLFLEDLCCLRELFSAELDVPTLKQLSQPYQTLLIQIKQQTHNI